MSPHELLQLCQDNIAEWDEHKIGEEPTVMLTLSRKTVPTGKSVRLYGRTGPKGKIANIRKTQTGFAVVAYFPAIPIAQDIADHLGIELKGANEAF